MKQIKISDEVSVKIKAIPPLGPGLIQANYEKKHPKPKQPTYEFEAVNGVIIQEPHNEDTVATDEEKAAFSAWQVADNEWQTGLSKTLLDFLLKEGTEIVATESVIAEWDAQLIEYGFELPERKAARDYLYLTMFCITTPELLQRTSSLIMEATGVSKADLDAANALF